MKGDELMWNGEVWEEFVKGNGGRVRIELYDILGNERNMSGVMSGGMGSDRE